MKTKNKNNYRIDLRILALILLAAILFLGIGCVNSSKTAVVTAIAPTKMNILYVGIDNPLKIAVSGYDPSELTVSIDNGSIKGQNGEYIVNPSKTGENAVVTVSCKGKEIQKATFRVKIVPDPVAKIAGIKGEGWIRKELLLVEQGIIAEIENCEFDMNFKVTEFKMSTNLNGSNIEIYARGNRFTNEQYSVFKKLNIGSKVYFEEIKVEGSDGLTRQLAPVILRLGK